MIVLAFLLSGTVSSRFDALILEMSLMILRMMNELKKLMNFTRTSKS